MWQKVKIAGDTWSLASEIRKIEWRALIASIENYPSDSAKSGTLIIDLREEGYALSVEFPATQPHKTFIPKQVLAPFVTEYIDIVRQLARTDQPGGLQRLEALDMAKKVVHDKAGREIRKQFRPTRISLELGRFLFSLLLSLRVDTTRLVGVHGHRRIR